MMFALYGTSLVLFLALTFPIYFVNSQREDDSVDQSPDISESPHYGGKDSYTEDVNSRTFESHGHHFSQPQISIEGHNEDHSEFSEPAHFSNEWRPIQIIDEGSPGLRSPTEQLPEQDLNQASTGLHEQPQYVEQVFPIQGAGPLPPGLSEVLQQIQQQRLAQGSGAPVPPGLSIPPRFVLRQRPLPESLSQPASVEFVDASAGSPFQPQEISSDNIPVPVDVGELLDESSEVVNVPYQFGYDMSDGNGTNQYRQEASDTSGVVTGSYGYKDPLGVYRLVNYVADKTGFHAVIKTNEPGVGNQGSADVVVMAEKPPLAALMMGQKKVAEKNVATDGSTTTTTTPGES